MKCPLILLFFFFLLATISAQPIDAQLRARFDSVATKYIDNDDPGAAVGIVRNGQVIYEKYVGIADLKAKVATPIGPATRFNVASVAKQFTAMIVLQLAEEGKLKLDEDFRTYVPDVLTNVKTPITVHQLLNHSSGIRDVYDLWRLQGFTWWKEKFGNQDALELLRQQQELNFPPGSKKLYSNSNYLLLTEVVARVTGQSFQDYSRQLFQRWDLNSTRFLSDRKDPIANAAKPYFNFNKWFGYKEKSELHGDGALFTTLPDQLKWETIIQTNGGGIISQEVIERSQQPVPESEVEDYGYGIEFGELGGVPYRFHSGGTGAWKANVIRFSDPALSIVAITNSGAIFPPGVTRDLAELLVQEINKTEIPIELAEVGASLDPTEWLGVYRTEWGYYMRFKKENQQLLMERIGRNAIEMELEKGNVYQETTDPAFKQVFTRNEAGEMQVTIYYPGVETFTLNKVKDEWNGTNAEALNGTYWSQETQSKIRIKHKEKDDYSVNIGGSKYQGNRYDMTNLLIDGYRMSLVLNSSGKVEELRLFNGRLQEVKFVRVR